MVKKYSYSIHSKAIVHNHYHGLWKEAANWLSKQEVLQKITSANFTRAGYKEEFQKLVSDIHQKYKDMGFQYDKETNHSIKKDEQKRWDTFFNDNVKR